MNIKEKIRQYKKVKISGVKFVIRKINPLVDFAPDKIPQIFTAFRSNRPVNTEKVLDEASIKQNIEDMKNMIIAGLVKPEINDLLTIDDIISDVNIAFKLYVEILVHSLNVFKGLKGLFFSIRLKRGMFTQWRKHTAKHLLNFYSEETAQ